MISKPRHNNNNYNNNKQTFKKRPSSNEIKITNLHPNLTSNDLEKLMNTVGKVQNVELKLNTQGQSVGVAFIKFLHNHDAIKAVDKFDGRLAAGQVINVSLNTPLIDRIGINIGPIKKNNNKGKNNNNNNNNKKKNEKKFKPKSIDELDNELDSYMNGNSDVQSEPMQESEQQYVPIIPVQEQPQALVEEQVPVQEQTQEPVV